jgi:glutaredoxin
MKSNATFYHAGCPVCIEVEEQLAHSLDSEKFKVEIVHLGNEKSRILEAERAGVKSVPALVLNGKAFHINFGASIDALK